MLCVEPVLGERNKNGCWKSQENELNGWEEIIKNGLKNNILIKIKFWDVEEL